jgi:hypothetical protein
MLDKACDWDGGAGAGVVGDEAKSSKACSASRYKPSGTRIAGLTPTRSALRRCRWRSLFQVTLLWPGLLLDWLPTYCIVLNFFDGTGIKSAGGTDKVRVLIALSVNTGRLQC